MHFLVLHKKFRTAQNFLEPVERQDLKALWTYLYSFSDLTPLVVDFDHGKLQSNGVIKFMVRIKAAIEGCRWGSMKPGLKVFPRYTLLYILGQ